MKMKYMSAYADQNHAPGLVCVLLELIKWRVNKWLVLIKSYIKAEQEK